MKEFRNNARIYYNKIYVYRTYSMHSIHIHVLYTHVDIMYNNLFFYFSVSKTD